MSTSVICRVAYGGLRCVNECESSKLEGLLGKEVEAKITIPRNLGFHKRFFAMLKTTLEMTDLKINIEQWRTLVTCGCGYADYVEFNGQLIAVPKSIAFARMDETEFERFYSDALSFICENYIHGTPDEINTILSFM